MPPPRPTPPYPTSPSRFSPFWLCLLLPPKSLLNPSMEDSQSHSHSHPNQYNLSAPLLSINESSQQLKFASSDAAFSHTVSSAVGSNTGARYKLMSPAKLPISRSSACITIPPGLSPSSFLESPVLLSNIKVSPTSHHMKIHFQIWEPTH